MGQWLECQNDEEDAPQSASHSVERVATRPVEHEAENANGQDKQQLQQNIGLQNIVALQPRRGRKG